MVKLRQGSNVLESELNEYFDYDNNFPQLLEDYLRSGVMEHKYNKSKQTRNRFISNQRTQLTDLYNNGEIYNKRIEEFKKWMSDKLDYKLANINSSNSDYLKRIDDLENEVFKLKKAMSIIQLKLIGNVNHVTEIIPDQVYDLDPHVEIEEEEQQVYDLDPYVEDEPIAESEQSEEDEEPIFQSNKNKLKELDKQESQKFKANKKDIAVKDKEKKQVAYQLEIDYLNSFEDCLEKEFPALVNDFSEGELDIEEVKEELEIVYNNKLNNLKDPLVNMIRLRNKTKIHIQDLIEEFENL
tara:strand:+ start:69 stop:959 length:891 start_codon:yes stop_codon:yes gene_type:complete